MNKNIVIYHSADFDGIFCREIARKFLPEAELIGWNYGQPVPEVSLDDHLYMLDISIDDLMSHPNLIWIDHHKSAIKKHGPGGPNYSWKGGRHAYCIDGVAACRLAWQWFRYGKGIPWTPATTKKDFVERMVMEPWAVRLAGEYDIWDKRDPDVDLFQHGLRSQELFSSDWDELLNEEKPGSSTVVRLLNQGRALQYAKTQENESIIKELGFTFIWEGFAWLACNAARYNSNLFTAGLKPEHDACFGFKWTGKDWSVSLYHAPGKEHHDLSEIAVKYGGGGHAGACGFLTNKLPFLP